jgi:RimJ/RimL family protein N-acetyltransferase
VNRSEPPAISLREWPDEDLPLLHQTMGDAAMTEHLGGPERVEQLARRHQRYLALAGSGKGHMLVIAISTAAAPVGTVGYWEKHWQDELVWEIGWAVIPAYQRTGIAARATAAAIERARAEDRYRFIHARPSVTNPASNAICRELGFTLIGEYDFEYPVGNPMRCNDWRLDLWAWLSEPRGRSRPIRTGPDQGQDHSPPAIVRSRALAYCSSLSAPSSRRARSFAISSAMDPAGAGGLDAGGLPSLRLASISASTRSSIS